MDPKALHMNSTIVAAATPPGRGGVGIIRFSGPRSLELGLALFRPGKGTLEPGRVVPRHMYYGRLADPHQGLFLDEALAVYFPSPHSFTTEDCFEIHTHGGPVILNLALEMALEMGAEAAQPGEFSLRAFRGGRIDLSQAEAVAQIIEAGSLAQARLAAARLKGGLSRLVDELRGLLLEVQAPVEAAIDFPEEVDWAEAGREAVQKLREMSWRTENVLENTRRFQILETGLKVAIAGRPNVGKSSLFNALLGRTRALVSPSPGTTRDYISEDIVLDSLQCRIVDTAGLGCAVDGLDLMGQEASREALDSAQAIILVLDSSQALTPDDLDLWRREWPVPVVAVLNKSDLFPAWDPGALPHPNRPLARVSALRSEGLGVLADLLVQALAPGLKEPVHDFLVAGQRQTPILQQLLEFLHEAEKLLPNDPPSLELVSVVLHQARETLSALDGHLAPDEVIDAVFSRFCVGK